MKLVVVFKVAAIHEFGNLRMRTSVGSRAHACEKAVVWREAGLYKHQIPCSGETSLMQG